MQLQTFSETNCVSDNFQSGCRCRNSTDLALLKVYHDIALSVNSGNITLLVLLDLTAAFDTGDYAVLVSRLAHHVGICAPGLDRTSPTSHLL